MKDFQTFCKKFVREAKPFWVLMDDKRKKISSTPDHIMSISDKAERLAESLEHLKSVLADEPEALFHITLQTEKNTGNTKIEDKFYTSDEPPASPRPAAVGGMGMGNALNSISGFELITGIMQRNEPEVNRLREENTNLKLELLKKDFEINAVSGQQQQNNWSEIGKTILEKYFPIILEKISPTPAPVAIGTLTAATAAQDETMATRLTNILNWVSSEFDGHPVETLEKIVELAKSDPMILMAIKMKLK